MEVKEIVFMENDIVNFEPKSIGRIVSARYGENTTYGHVDVFVAGFLKPDGSLNFQVSNESMRNDPLPYVKKKLILKYTDFVERNETPPKEIKVENAGNNDVNGVYIPNGIQWHCRDKSYCSNYKKKTNPDFEIYHEGPGLYWYIHNDNENSPYKRIPLYKCKSDSRIPPLNGWTQYGSGGLASDMPIVKVLDDNQVLKNEIYSDGMYAGYIAIDKYKDESLGNLECCNNDQKLLEQTLKSLGYKTLFSLSNEKATKRNIEKTFDHIYNVLKSKKNSSFILYIAGHGCKKEGFDKFLCYDHSPDKMISTTFDYDFINNYAKKFNAKHQLIISDACFSGSIIKEKLRNKVWNQDIANSRSMHAISSVQNSGKAVEHQGNGIFTKSFVKTLNQLLDEDCLVKLSDISNKLEKNINERLSSINIQMEQTHVPKIGRLYKEITSRDDNHQKVELNGEILFFRQTILHGAKERGGNYDEYYEPPDDDEYQGMME
jgi:hypothetical protein